MQICKYVCMYERVEVAEWIRRWSPPFPWCPVNCVRKRKPDRKKKQTEILQKGQNTEM